MARRRGQVLTPYPPDNYSVMSIIIRSLYVYYAVPIYSSLWQVEYASCDNNIVSPTALLTQHNELFWYIEVHEDTLTMGIQLDGGDIN